MERKQQLGNLASSFLNNFHHAGVGNFTRRNQITPFNLQSTDYLPWYFLIFCTASCPGSSSLSGLKTLSFSGGWNGGELLTFAAARESSLRELMTEGD